VGGTIFCARKRKTHWTLLLCDHGVKSGQLPGCDHGVNFLENFHFTVGLGRQLPGSRCLYNERAWQATVWVRPCSKHLKPLHVTRVLNPIPGILVCDPIPRILELKCPVWVPVRVQQNRHGIIRAVAAIHHSLSA